MVKWVWVRAGHIHTKHPTRRVCILTTLCPPLRIEMGGSGWLSQRSKFMIKPPARDPAPPSSRPESLLTGAPASQPLRASASQANPSSQSASQSVPGTNQPGPHPAATRTHLRAAQPVMELSARRCSIFISNIYWPVSEQTKYVEKTEAV